MVFDFFARRRRSRLRMTPFPESWRVILTENVPLYQRLTSQHQQDVEGHVRVLIAEKHFEGCGGLVLTDEIRVTIAGHAALLLLGREPHYFPRLVSILVYPSTYVVDTEERDGMVVTEHAEERLGESWKTGVVVLSWDAARAGARELRDASNLVLHEFAHQLDSEDGRSDGVPLLDRAGDYAAWARALEPEYRKLQSEPERSLLDEYGATNPAEFFAVATEAFFERPRELKERHPALYAELSAFYHLDLATDGAPQPSTETQNDHPQR
ncbi:MAG TPA: M90 family metallopeptidase [Gemmatimonadaceae bacterium]|nr:M90 family metallopeptidase [Gemmatimonadaceae bacterium]